MSEVPGKWHQAGHAFENGVRCQCGRYWLDIRNTQRSEIGQDGIAHIGKLNEVEYLSIERRRNDEEATEREALGAVAGNVTREQPVASFKLASTFFTWFVMDGEDPDELIPF